MGTPGGKGAARTKIKTVKIKARTKIKLFAKDELHVFSLESPAGPDPSSLQRSV